MVYSFGGGGVDVDVMCVTRRYHSHNRFAWNDTTTC